MIETLTLSCRFIPRTSYTNNIVNDLSVDKNSEAQKFSMDKRQS